MTQGSNGAIIIIVIIIIIISIIIIIIIIMLIIIIMFPAVPCGYFPIKTWEPCIAEGSLFCWPLDPLLARILVTRGLYLGGPDTDLHWSSAARCE